MYRKRNLHTIGLASAEYAGDYSSRTARIGSTVMARRAGT
jgi:hypothetical protein